LLWTCLAVIDGRNILTAILICAVDLGLALNSNSLPICWQLHCILCDSYHSVCFGLVWR
jgi:hypothetical protein